MGFPGGSDGKESTCNAGDLGSVPGLGRSPGEGISSILAWQIPWTEEPGRLQSMGCKEWDTIYNDLDSVICSLFFTTFCDCRTVIGNGEKSH